MPCRLSAFAILIPCRCFANMLTEEEEHAGEEARGQGQGGGGRGEAEDDLWGAAGEGISGRLGRAFHAGYTAETPGEFFERFGFRV